MVFEMVLYIRDRDVYPSPLLLGCICQSSPGSRYEIEAPSLCHDDHTSENQY